MNDKIQNVIQTIGGMLCCLIPLTAIVLLWIEVYVDIAFRIFISELIMVSVIYYWDKYLESKKS